jgi:hypothetical protein
VTGRARASRLSLASLVVVLLAGACGTSKEGSRAVSPNTSSPVTSGPVQSSPGTLPPSMQPNKVAPNPRAVELRAVRWSRVEGAGLVLTVHYVSSGRAECNVLGRADVVETAKTVTITLMVGHLPGAGCAGPQPLIATVNTTTVTLSHPLGSRTLIDGGAPVTRLPGHD